jgi:hypothetical protein
MTNFLLKREIQGEKSKEIKETPTDRRTNKKEIESKTDRQTDRQTDRKEGEREGGEREREREIDLCFLFYRNLRTYFRE